MCVIQKYMCPDINDRGFVAALLPFVILILPFAMCLQCSAIMETVSMLVHVCVFELV